MIQYELPDAGILRPKDEQRWLDPELSEKEIMGLKPYPDKVMAGIS